jgi:hypothetical protein
LNLELRPLRVETGGPDEEGLAAFASDKLVAVFVRLSAEHGEKAGQWYAEKLFGRLDRPSPLVFPDLDTLKAWLATEIS